MLTVHSSPCFFDVAVVVAFAVVDPLLENIPIGTPRTEKRVSAVLPLATTENELPDVVVAVAVVVAETLRILFTPLDDAIVTKLLPPPSFISIEPLLTDVDAELDPVAVLTLRLEPVVVNVAVVDPEPVSTITALADVVTLDDALPLANLTKTDCHDVLSKLNGKLSKSPQPSNCSRLGFV